MWQTVVALLALLALQASCKELTEGALKESEPKEELPQAQDPNNIDVDPELSYDDYGKL